MSNFFQKTFQKSRNDYAATELYISVVRKVGNLIKVWIEYEYFFLIENTLSECRINLGVHKFEYE